MDNNGNNTTSRLHLAATVLTEHRVKQLILLNYVRGIYKSRWFFMRWLYWGIQLIVEIAYDNLDKEDTLKIYTDLVIRSNMRKNNKYAKFFNQAKEDVLESLRITYPGELVKIEEIRHLL